MIECVVDNKPDSTNLYTKVFKAAKQRQDHELSTRLLGVVNGDPVAVGARHSEAD